MKRKLAIFMSFVMLFSTAVILPADKEHPAKAEETVTASGYWTDVAEPFQTKDASGNVLGSNLRNSLLIWQRRSMKERKKIIFPEESTIVWKRILI